MAYSSVVIRPAARMDSSWVNFVTMSGTGVDEADSAEERAGVAEDEAANRDGGVAGAEAAEEHACVAGEEASMLKAAAVLRNRVEPSPCT